MNLDGIPAPFRPYFDEMPNGNGNGKVHGEGSGFVISADGYVLTNNHVVEQATEIVARFADGREVTAEVVGTDPATDVALLKLDGQETWPHVDLGDSGAPRVGDWVVAVGNPLGMGITVTAGIVSATGRSLGHDAYDDFIQTDAAINQGNSGGPLFDTSGKVVGMNTAIIQGANTVGFAVPSELILDVVSELRADGRVSRGYLGVELQTMDVTLAKAMGVPNAAGALVASVQPGAPAAEAGLEDGDVITTIAGTPVKDSTTLVRAVAKHDPGEKVAVVALRDGREKQFTVTLAERPGRADGDDAPPAVSSNEEVTDGRKLGIALAPLPENARRTLGATTGVVVSEVAPDAPADGKLQPGDVIQEIDGKAVNTPDEAREAIKKSDDTVVLKVVRRGDARFVAIAR
jgi:serine protease Do